jgi:hypothetical protein
LEGADDVTGFDQGEGAQAASITSHAFEPEDAWWTMCRVCGMSEAAHETTTLSPNAEPPAHGGGWCEPPRLVTADERRRLRGEL